MSAKYKYFMCRLCLRESGILCDIHVFKVERGLIPATLIFSLLQLEVSVTDIYPKLVCIECLRKLTDFQTFKDACWKAKVNFQTLYRNEAFSCDNGSGGRCDHGVSADANDAVPFKTCEDYSNQCNKVYREERKFHSEVVIKEEPIEINSGMGWEDTQDPSCGKQQDTSSTNRLFREIFPKNGADYNSNQINSGMGWEDNQDPSCGKQQDTSSTNRLFREIFPKNGADYNSNQVTSQQLEENNLANETFVPSVLNNSLTGSLIFLPAQNGGNVAGKMQVRKEGTNSTANGMETGKEGNIPATQYFCKKCSKLYRSMASLVSHNCARHMLINFECNVCGEKFESESILWGHMQKHNCKMRWYCSICGMGFLKEDQLSVHFSSHKSNLPIQPIGASSPVFSIPLDNDSGQIQINCVQEKVVPNEHVTSDLGKEQVENKQQESVTENVSTIYNRSFSSTGPLKRHVKYVHSEKLFECKICHKKFSSEKCAEGHSRTHGENRPYCCGVCGKRFVREIHFLKHMSTHAVDDPFQCDRCGKKFNQKNKSFRVHIARCYRTKAFQCDVCNKEYQSEAYLSVHKTIHTGEKNFVCEVCGRTFQGINTLMIHRRQHTGEKPYYHCDICDRKFTQKTSFVYHNKRYH